MYCLQGVRKAVGEALAASPSCLSTLCDRAALQDTVALQVSARINLYSHVPCCQPFCKCMIAAPISVDALRPCCSKNYTASYLEQRVKLSSHVTSHLVCAFALQMLLHCCRSCPALCEATAAANLPDVLLRSACSTASNTAALSLLVLAALVSGVTASIKSLAVDAGSVQQRRLTAAVQVLGPSQATDAVIVKLAGM